jgi:4-carboxymuconolactone decarboxylase
MPGFLSTFKLTWLAPAGRQCGSAIYIDRQDTPNRKGNVIMAKKTAYEIVPQLGKLRDEVLFGDVWEQPELSKRDRSLVTISVLTALYRTDELRGHMKRALDNGVTQDEIRGMITHLAFYAGWPTAVNAGRIAVEVFEDD